MIPRLGFVQSPWGALMSPLAFEVIYRLGFPYLLMFIAFVPAGLIRRYNQVGDCSYGIYVYACPVQQMVVALLPGVSTWALSGIALSITLVRAEMSWRWVEKPALRLKPHADRIAQWRFA